MQFELEEFTMYCEMKNLSPKTVKWYGDMLGRFSQFLAGELAISQIEAVRPAHIRIFVKSLTDRGLSPNTINCYLRAIKVWFKYFCSEGLIESNPCDKVDMMKVPKKAIKTFEPQQLLALFDGFDRNSFPGIRSYTMCRLLLDTGMRITELLNLEVRDVDPKERLALIRHGKGDKERYVVGIPF